MDGLLIMMMAAQLGLDLHCWLQMNNSIHQTLINTTSDNLSFHLPIQKTENDIILQLFSIIEVPFGGKPTCEV